MGQDLVDLGRRWIAPRHVVVLILAALLPLLIVNATETPSATGVAAMALVLGVLVAAGLTYVLAALVAVINRRMTSYRRQDGVTIESNDTPIHPVRPRAPGLA